MKIQAFLLLACMVLARAAGPLTAAESTTNKVARWAFQTEGPIRGAPVVADGSVYFGSADGFLYAVDEVTGTLRWRFQTGGAIAGAPAIAGGTVVVAGRGPDVHALDTVSGIVKWSFRLGADVLVDVEWDYFTAAPVVADHLVLVASGDGKLHALELAGGRERWSFATGDRLRATPLVARETVYQPSGDDHVYALALRDGALQWKFATEGVKLDRSQGFIRSDIFTQPSLSQGLLVFGSRDANVYAVDIATHQAAWSFHYDSTWAMATVADADTVYVGWSTNNKVCALDLKTGEKKWEYTAGAHNYAPALIDGDALIRGSADGRLYSFDKRSGAINWTYDVGVEVYSAAVRNGGTLYFGADDGKLRALVEAPPAKRMVYLPADVPDNIHGFVVDDGLVPYLVNHGFERIDSREGLGKFLDARVTDGTPSVVVFAFAQIPPAVVGDDPAQGPLRAYLDAGGKIVWPWGLPNLHLFDVEGNYVRRDATVGPRLLGVSFLENEDSGNYSARATQTGRNWGLPAGLKATFASIVPGSDVTELATDEYGRSIAWVRSFHPRSGSGWVQFSPSSFGVPMREGELALMAGVANYGLE